MSEVPSGSKNATVVLKKSHIHYQEMATVGVQLRLHSLVRLTQVRQNGDPSTNCDNLQQSYLS